MSRQIELIRQALSAAESSIRLAKQLLNELENAGSDNNGKKVLPGVVGTFDGENMVTETGEKFPVPANYASKSMLVVGDTLKLVEEAGQRKFKQIEHVKRYKTKGVLTKKEGKFHVVAPEGSYRVLPAAVDHFQASADSGDIVVVVPAKNLNSTWAAIESIFGKEKLTLKYPEEKAGEIGVVGAFKKDQGKKKVDKKTEPSQARRETKESIKQESNKGTDKVVDKDKREEKIVEVSGKKAEGKKLEEKKEDKEKVEESLPARAEVGEDELR